MTIDEAIIALKRIRKDWQFTYSYDCEAVEMAIRALKNEQTDGDLISKSVFDQIKWERDVAIFQLHDLDYELGEKPRTDGDLINRQSVIDIVEFECGEWKGLAKTIVKAIEQLPSEEKTTIRKIKL